MFEEQLEKISIMREQAYDYMFRKGYKDYYEAMLLLNTICDVQSIIITQLLQKIEEGKNEKHC